MAVNEPPLPSATARWMRLRPKRGWRGTHELVEFSVKSVTRGIDAMGEVTIPVCGQSRRCSTPAFR